MDFEKTSVYFDSCVLIDSIIFRKGYVKVNSKRKFDIGKISFEKAEVILSELNVIEVTESLKDAMVSQIAIGEGYSYFDLRKDRLEKIKLSKKQLEEIDSIFQKELVSLRPVRIVESQGFSGNEVKNLVKICNKHSIFLVDAMHFLVAYKSGCSFFVTADKDLRKKLLKVNKGFVLASNMEILTPLQFKKLFRLFKK